MPPIPKPDAKGSVKPAVGSSVSWFLFSVFYNVFYFFFGLVSLPRFIGKVRQSSEPGVLLRQRLGIFPRSFADRFKGKIVIWVHAVSVGEVLAVQPFIEGFLKRARDFHVVLTTVTATGQQMAKKMDGEHVSVCYIPFDLTPAVRSFLKCLNPHCLLLAETEIWPNLILEAIHIGIPIGILNARLSAKSERGYRHFSFLFRPLFEQIDFVMAQTEEDAYRFESVGVDPSRIQVMGNMKFDIGPLDLAAGRSPEVLRAEWGLAPDDLVWIAGSTHPGEEEILIRVYCKLREKFEKLKLIIAPRHIERSERVARMVRKYHSRVALATKRHTPGPFDVLILDQLGVLRSLYCMADVVFVGGSLNRRGGQNPIEPASFKRAILHGPHVVNFHGVYQILNQEGGALPVGDERQLAFAAARLLEREEERRSLGESAFSVIEKMKGATKRQLDWVLEFLSPRFQERIQDAAFREKLLSSSGGGL